MRPAQLYSLFTDISVLPGVGERNRAKLNKLLGGERIIDLLNHIPSHFIDRRAMPKISELRGPQVVTWVVEVLQYDAPPAHRKQLPFKVRCVHDTGFVTLVFFKAYPDYIQKTLPIGSKRVISGKVEFFGAEVQMAHPDYIALPEELEHICVLEPCYPLTAGVSQKQLHKWLTAALADVPVLPEWISADVIKKHGWDSWQHAMRDIHHPTAPEAFEPDHPTRARLAYDELLASQLAFKLTRYFVTKVKGVAVTGEGELIEKFKTHLPFALTNGQEATIKEIHRDQATPERMMRLLQGDVGSGKTVVALCAMLRAVEAGKQAALMAPTEILAKQHYAWISTQCEPLGLKVALLTAAVKGKARQTILDQLASGEIHLIIGTHALFSEKVTCKDLALAVIDEQHRFGVNQRLALAEKGNMADILLMSATPIPRTLTLSVYGDMECSILSEKPKGRQEIDTRVIPINRMSEVAEGLARVIERGERIYWICPLIDESEQADLAAAKDRYDRLKKIYGDKVALVHGKMKQEEREAEMTAFKEGKRSILVATTVIEVGVDVPEATVIVIEHAERFGLAQLHQLRGRVGRGSVASSCILLYQSLGKTSKKRLMMMRESNDGFLLAEEDLKIRGSGDILGTKQSGWPHFTYAHLGDHFDLLKLASKDAAYIMQIDPFLKTDRGAALRHLLYLFEYDAQMKYIYVG